MSSPQGEKPKILFIDDDIGLLELLTDHAAASGFEPHTLPDAREALARAIDVSPDLIVLDVSMPHRSGFEVFAELRSDERTADVPVIFLTASGTDIMQRVKGLEMGAWDFLAKPITPEELKARLVHHLALAKKSREGVERDLTVLRHTATYLNHTINNLLTAVQLAADLILEESSSERDRRRVSLIAKNVMSVREVLAKLRQIKQVKTTQYIGQEQMLDLDGSIANKPK